MGDLTMSQIASWQPAGIIAGADEAKTRNTQLLGILDGIKDATNKMAGESSGTGEAARFDFIDRTTKFGHDKHELMVAHQQLAEEAGYDLAAKRDRLLTEVQAARKAGLVVWDDGKVSGEIPRQADVLRKYTESIGQLKHDLEQADAEHARKIRDLNDKIKEGTGGGLQNADHFEKFGAKDEPLDADKAAKERAQRIADGAEPIPTDPKELHDLWDKLGEKEKGNIYDRYHDIGNHGGIPFIDRDRYNRQNLTRLRDEAQARLNDLENHLPDWGPDNLPQGSASYQDWKKKDDEARKQLNEYNNVLEAVSRQDPPRFLGFIDDKGRAAVSVGNPDLAKRNATFVPGTTVDLSKMALQDSHAADLYRTTHLMDRSLGPNDVSVTAWLGYDRPMSLDDPLGPWAGYESYARNGAQALDDWQNGIRASHDDAAAGGRSFNVVIGHSYGSTEVGAAASAGHHLDADAIIAVGSPGMLVHTAHELDINQGAQVYAALAQNDIIKLANEHFDVNPAYWSDATRFTTDPGDPGPLGTGQAHGSYFNPGGKGLLNMAKILAGQEPERQE